MKDYCYEKILFMQEFRIKLIEMYNITLETLLMHLKILVE
jgi:hypothetical protein